MLDLSRHQSSSLPAPSRFRQAPLVGLGDGVGYGVQLGRRQWTNLMLSNTDNSSKFKYCTKCEYDRQTAGWSSQFGSGWDCERVAVSPHVGTCVCAPATLSLSFCGKISCRLGERVNHSCEGLPSRESEAQRLRRLGLDFTSPFHSR